MIDHILGQNSSLVKFKKIEIVSSIFSDHNAMRLEINYRKKTVKNTNTWRLNSVLLNNQEITEEIKEERKKYIETNDSENTKPQTYGTLQKQFSEGSLSQFNLTSRNKKNHKQSNPTLKTTRERRTKKTRSQ